MSVAVIFLCDIHGGGIYGVAFISRTENGEPKILWYLSLLYFLYTDIMHTKNIYTTGFNSLWSSDTMWSHIWINTGSGNGSLPNPLVIEISSKITYFIQISQRLLSLIIEAEWRIYASIS